ncbi:Pyridoxine-5'-phosphate oxidase [Taenia solium]|eukprot:TsM_000289800 transcript=TsM_000289800 gene=TsM_000289800
MRIPYRKESDRLHDNSITLTHPLKQFQAWFEEAVTCSGLYEANAMVLSTVSKYLLTLFNRMLRSGRPSSRYVLLKGLDDRGFHFYTNSVRIEGKASLLPDIEAEEYFRTRSKKSQISAYVSQQSKPIESDRQILSAFEEAERQFKDYEHIPKPETWVGYTVMPDRMEFWQGQTTRLHDRFLFFRPDDDKPISEFSKPCEEGWYCERLAP